MSALQPTQEALEQGAETIRRGGVVIMPTETVYGLACSALNRKAVERVFEIKGRPSENPLIVHVASIEAAKEVCSEWPALAEKLARRFWPGPLTLVLPKAAHVPLETTGGLDTVAVRIPDHAVALDLIGKSGCPVAAPSANMYMGLSPTRVEDLDPAILVDVDMAFDGGPCRIGLESTVLDLSDGLPRILRPGGLPRAELQAAIGRPLGQIPPDGARRSPGMSLRHYAPQARVEVVESIPSGQPGLLWKGSAESGQIKMPDEPTAYGAQLYAAMRALDGRGAQIIFIESLPDSQEWEAVADRLRKAAAPAPQG